MGNPAFQNNGKLIQLTAPRHFISDGVYQKFVELNSVIKHRQGET